MIDLSIVIASWNTRDLLAQCLTSLYANPPACIFEVCIVDNASKDGSGTLVAEQFPQVKLIQNERNIGFGAANNQAIRATTGRFILMLNTDVIVLPDALSRMVAFMDDHPQAGIIGSYVMNPDGSTQPCFWNFPTIRSETIYAWGLDSRRPFAKWLAPRFDIPGEYRETGYVLGATMMTRRETLNQTGAFDENFFMYSEEVDLCRRVWNAGWKNYVLGTARLVHLGNASAGQIPAPMKSELFLNKIRYFRKHHGAWTARVMRFIFGTSILTRYWMYQLKQDRDNLQLWLDTWMYFSGKKNNPISRQ